MEEVVLGYDGSGAACVGTQDREGDTEMAVRELDFGGGHDDCEFEYARISSWWGQGLTEQLVGFAGHDCRARQDEVDYWFSDPDQAVFQRHDRWVQRLLDSTPGGSRNEGIPGLPARDVRTGCTARTNIAVSLPQDLLPKS